MSTALLVLDMINDLAGLDGLSAGSGIPEETARLDLVAHINEAIAAARSADVPVVWVALGFDPSYADWPAGSPIFGGARGAKALAAGSWGSQPLDSLDTSPGDALIVKPRVSPFFGTRLDVLLKTLGVDEVTLAGVATEHVVVATARDAHDRDLRVTVLTDCCASANPELREHGLAVLKYFTRQIESTEFISETVASQ